MEGDQGLRVWYNDRMSKMYGTLGSGKRKGRRKCPSPYSPPRSLFISLLSSPFDPLVLVHTHTPSTHHYFILPSKGDPSLPLVPYSIPGLCGYTEYRLLSIDLTSNVHM